MRHEKCNGFANLFPLNCRAIPSIGRTKAPFITKLAVTACDAALGARQRQTDKLADTKTTANPSTWKQLATRLPRAFLVLASYLPGTTECPALIRQRRWMRLTLEPGVWQSRCFT